MYRILPDTRKFSNKKLFQFEKSDFKIFTVSHQARGNIRVLENMKEELRPHTVQTLARAARMMLTEWNVSCSSISSLICVTLLLRAESVTREQYTVGRLYSRKRK